MISECFALVLAVISFTRLWSHMLEITVIRSVCQVTVMTVLNFNHSNWIKRCVISVCDPIDILIKSIHRKECPYKTFVDYKSIYNYSSYIIQVVVETEYIVLFIDCVTCCSLAGVLWIRLKRTIMTNRKEITKGTLRYVLPLCFFLLKMSKNSLKLTW